MKKLAWWAISLLLFAEPSWGADPAPSSSSTIEPTKRSTSIKPKRKRVRRFREKETEGTKAPGRFEFQTNSVLESRYRFRGRPLEVDPD